ncbi:amidophosphoribosyltransferase [Herbaspirillum rubrisubalbicans]|uniref:Amidophosphoribosyltransferase n=1 Tax=Herbaspirillum rubrisubalbicans TaxID=80842 RepID=A0ABX9C536_9BURK|nr:ComF family protein [Herbaspirillum rubrisubalbicans]RAM65687.1 amidophosphoribosyltransferase [Herbaspirillum rubrisubalbicans]RAN43848.1 amidophosphoribosyltransferase [Herbaspirillum rubrisubalbicans]
MDVKPAKPATATPQAKPGSAYRAVGGPPARPGKTTGPGWLQRLLARLPQLLPSSCALCGAAGRETLCAPCHKRFYTRQHRRCIQCAMPMPVTGKELRCGACLKDRPAFDATIVATDYFAPSDQLALALKFGGDLRLAPLLARLIYDATRRNPVPGSDVQLPLPTVLAPVPLGLARLQERGFNQALEIARPLGQLLDIPVQARLLERKKETQAQSALPVGARARNVRSAFALPFAAMDQVRGLHVGIVDDVMTTGATLNEVAIVLKRHGARRVTNLVFARTLPT